MALTVETGTGSASAESYISVADASTYHSNRGNSAWAALTTDAVREQCLRKATDYMVASFRDRWQGERVSEDQALDWPRNAVVVEGYLLDNDSVPETIKRACAELALKAATDDLQPDLTQGVLSESVGAISVTYDKASPQGTRFSFVNIMLAPFFKAGASGRATMGLVRA